MDLPGFGNIRLDSLSSLYKFHTTVDVFRLDLLHPVVSGNKWFKLSEYLNEAKQLGKSNVITWGGPFSNHLLATAAAAQAQGLKSTGIVRGERPAILSHTLVDALSYGMDLFFMSRAEYNNQIIPPDLLSNTTENERYFIRQGGYGSLGAKGAERIFSGVEKTQYTHIIAAVGTGTTLAGIIAAATENQQVIGISVFKNNFSLEGEIDALVPVKKANRFVIVHNYHFGGYAKYSPVLIQFINNWYRSTRIPSDFVYTGKLFFAVDDLIRSGFFPQGSRLLLIHSGGLQGNRSLPKGTLIF